MIENNERLCSSEANSYYWLSFDGLKSIISINPYENLEPEKNKNREKIHFFIDNRQSLCEHGGLHPMIARNEKIYLSKYTIL